MMQKNFETLEMAAQELQQKLDSSDNQQFKNEALSKVSSINQMAHECKEAIRNIMRSSDADTVMRNLKALPGKIESCSETLQRGIHEIERLSKNTRRANTNYDLIIATGRVIEAGKIIERDVGSVLKKIKEVMLIPIDIIEWTWGNVFGSLERPMYR